MNKLLSKSTNTELTHKICWRSTITREVGQGKPMTQSSANIWLDKAKKRPSTLTHWIEKL